MRQPRQLRDSVSDSAMECRDELDELSAVMLEPPEGVMMEPQVRGGEAAGTIGLPNCEKWTVLNVPIGFL